MGRATTLHSFEADARRKPKMPEVESRPSPSPCPIPSSPPTSRALRILQLPRLLLLGAFRANARNDGRSP